MAKKTYSQRDREREIERDGETSYANLHSNDETHNKPIQSYGTKGDNKQTILNELKET